eukprot:jgi/Bigna1/84549/fgenesh1_pg.153_\
MKFGLLAYILLFCLLFSQWVQNMNSPYPTLIIPSKPKSVAAKLRTRTFKVFTSQLKSHGKASVRFQSPNLQVLCRSTCAESREDLVSLFVLLHKISTGCRTADLRSPQPPRQSSGGTRSVRARMQESEEAEDDDGDN